MALRAHIFGIANVTAAAVEAAVVHFALQRGGTCAPTVGTAEDFNILAVAGALDTHASVFVRSPQWWEIRDYLMHCFDVPFLAFAVYEHDFWCYELFITGNRIDSFNPNPAFWNDAPEVESWPSVGTPSVLCQYWPNIMATSIQNYFEPWTIEDDWYIVRKAYPDDRFPQGDVLQVSDFMRRLNLICPVSAAGQLSGNSYTLAIPSI